MGDAVERPAAMRPLVPTARDAATLATPVVPTTVGARPSSGVNAATAPTGAGGAVGAVAATPNVPAEVLVVAVVARPMATGNDGGRLPVVPAMSRWRLRSYGCIKPRLTGTKITLYGSRV